MIIYEKVIKTVILNVKCHVSNLLSVCLNCRTVSLNLYRLQGGPKKVYDVI